MSRALEFTILGSGSSGGVPRADGAWGVCDPSNPKNRRSRCSLLVRRRGQDPEHETTVLVDTSPDLRLQTAAAGARRIDAVLYTHDHADQAHGIDDLRAFFLRWRKRLPCYMDAGTSESLQRRFGYIFESHGGYPAICEARELPAHGRLWKVHGPSGEIPVVSFDLDHGEIRSAGFRFGPVAYCPDVLSVPEAAFATLEGVEVWIVDALRESPHPSHANLAQALSWIDRVEPGQAYLTHMNHEVDYTDWCSKLPPGVLPAHDGLVIELPD